MPSPCIAIVGAGALGGYYGARLAQHGHEVHFLMRSDYPHVARKGFNIRSVGGDFSLSASQLHLYDDPLRMPKVDLVIVTLKTTQNDQLERLIEPLLHEKSLILTLQNGLGNEDALAALFGAERVLGGMAFVCINRLGPGEIEHLEPGYIQLGDFAGQGRSERAEEIASLLRGAGIDAQVVENLKEGRWKKLVWNIPFNGLGALLDATTDVLLSSEPGIRLVRAIMEEVMCAARAAGVILPPDAPDRQIRATFPMGRYQTSTQVDRQRGKPMEIDSIFGAPVRIARNQGIFVPLMEMLLYSLQMLDARRG
jgi:2-dehydropantoate 2-reductase